jgi:hypothetical protein
MSPSLLCDAHIVVEPDHRFQEIGTISGQRPLGADASGERLADAFRPAITKVTARAASIAPHHQLAIEQRRNQIPARQQVRVDIVTNLTKRRTFPS